MQSNSRPIDRVTYIPRVGRVALLLVIGAIAIYWVAFWLALARSPLGSDIDFNGDGNISLLEALDGMRLPSREVVVDGRRCVDYFEPKTGSQWRLMCEK